MTKKKQADQVRLNFFIFLDMNRASCMEVEKLYFA